MARFAGLLALTLFSLGASARIDGLGDGLAAYQESLHAHKARESSEVIKLDVIEAIAKAVSSSTAAAASEGNTVSLEFKTSNVEDGSSVSLQMDDGCKEEKSGFTSCEIDLSKSSKIAVDIKPKDPLDDSTVMENELKVKVLIMEQSTSFKCKACGEACKIKMFGAEMETQSPSCPLPKDQVSIQMPFDKLTKMPSLPSFTAEVKTTVVRGDGSTVATFEMHLRK
eukprot:CAMPEP_0204519462 /NCGR_PEP_ID=MMETSP0661-20131031/4738_1 /ASSEMBLY_ACC=CAM_ASM_000606 /TAXON_ID=109239 /ORGANISM="Alexandrium margalefi, Strain AMGDE01CS-322" /LENGTH=224 /DNA_ID=CAMNT_0051524967 /DNA_START=71 /DNA_END=745 /DNA_ORIENTATION=+